MVAALTALSLAAFVGQAWQQRGAGHLSVGFPSSGLDTMLSGAGHLLLALALLSTCIHLQVAADDTGKIQLGQGVRKPEVRVSTFASAVIGEPVQRELQRGEVSQLQCTVGV